MKLNSFGWEFRVPYTHHYTLRRTCDNIHLPALSWIHNQRVIAANREWRGQIPVNPQSIMFSNSELAMDRYPANY